MHIYVCGWFLGSLRLSTTRISSSPMRSRHAAGSSSSDSTAWVPPGRNVTPKRRSASRPRSASGAGPSSPPSVIASPPGQAGAAVAPHRSPSPVCLFTIPIVLSVFVFLFLFFLEMISCLLRCGALGDSSQIRLIPPRWRIGFNCSLRGILYTSLSLSLSHSLLHSDLGHWFMLALCAFESHENSVCRNFHSMPCCMRICLCAYDLILCACECTFV